MSQTGKTEPTEPNKKKLSQTGKKSEPNRKKPSQTEKMSQT